jgi:hypothetical protein
MFYNIKHKSWNIIRESYFLFDDVFNLRSNSRIAKNTALKNRHNGERAFLLLTGESIEQLDIKKLKNEITFGSNLIILHKDIKDMDLTYFSNLDDNRTLKPDLPQWPVEQLGKLGNNGAKKFYQEINNRIPINTKLILNSNNYRHYKKEPSLKDRTIYYCKKGKILMMDEKIPIETLANMTNRLQGRGNFYYSIMMLLYMGVKEIYLCGSGYTYEPLHILHFYDMQNLTYPLTIRYEEALSEAQKTISIRNKEYFSNLSVKGLYENNGFYRAIITRPTFELETTIKQHEMVNRYSKSHGVKIINIVPDGFESPVFEKTTWTEVLKTLN